MPGRTPLLPTGGRPRLAAAALWLDQLFRAGGDGQTQMPEATSEINRKWQLSFLCNASTGSAQLLQGWRLSCSRPARLAGWQMYSQVSVPPGKARAKPNAKRVTCFRDSRQSPKYPFRYFWTRTHSATSNYCTQHLQE